MAPKANKHTTRANSGSRKSRSDRAKATRGLLADLRRLLRASRTTYRVVRDLPVTATQARMSRAERVATRRTVLEQTREARKAHRAARTREKIQSRHGDVLGGAFEVRRGRTTTRRASEEFGNRRPDPTTPPATAPAPNGRATLPPRTPRPSPPKSPKTTPPTPPVSTTKPTGQAPRRNLMSTTFTGRVTAVGVAIDQELLVAVAQTDLEELSGYLATYAGTMLRVFSGELGEDTQQVFGANKGQAGLLGPTAIRQFRSIADDASKTLSRAYADLSKAAGAEHDRVIKALSARFGKETLDAARKAARKTASASRAGGAKLGRATSVSASVDRLGLAEEPGIEDVIASVRTYGRSLRDTFGRNFPDSVFGLFAGRRKSLGVLETDGWVLPPATRARFLSTIERGGQELAQAYEWLGWELAKQHDLIIAMLADEFSSTTLGAASRMAPAHAG